MSPNLFQAATLKKIWVEATLKNSQEAPYKNMGRFYRVPFKSLLRVHIKGVNVFQIPLQVLAVYTLHTSTAKLVKMLINKCVQIL